MRDVYISLTSIPTRIDILRKCLDSLLKQSYPIKSIILTIPTRTLRSKAKTVIPDYLYESPYKEKVIIVQPKKDYGPVMKYIGGYNVITKNSLVFVCDDDQQYHKNLVKKLVKRHNALPINEQKETVVTASGYTILTTHEAWGFGSVLLPYDTIQLVRQKVVNSSRHVRKCCQLVDDNWVSIILKKYGIRIVNMKIGNEKFSNGKMLCPEDGLALTTNRVKDIIACTYAIDHENYYPLVALVLFILFIIVIIVNYYWISYM